VGFALFRPHVGIGGRGVTAQGRPRVGLIGCGNISEAYLTAGYNEVQFTACADLDADRAAKTAAAHTLDAMSVDDLLANPTIDVVCNLTVPQAHAEVSLAAVQAGKHVYQEKPLALDRTGGALLLKGAEDSRTRVGCAPDTFLGAGMQTCRMVIDEGAIGAPVSAMANMVFSGHEYWHPDPGFYYLRGGGPLFDMGPYYLTALVNLLGPVARVAAASPEPSTTRLVRSGPRKGHQLPVEVPTHVAGLLEFATGAVATIVLSFDVWASQLPKLEIHGTEGSLSLPDPNTFGGPVGLARWGSEGWEDVPTDHFSLHRRGVGLADMVGSIEHGRPHRASASLAYHVLEVMIGLTESAAQGCYIETSSDFERPEAMPAAGTQRREAVERRPDVDAT